MFYDNKGEVFLTDTQENILATGTTIIRQRKIYVPLEITEQMNLKDGDRVKIELIEGKKNTFLRVRKFYAGDL